MIRVHHVRMRSVTERETYGADVPLKSGLNIIQAENTSGKSTTVQSIIYGLGLEGALGSKRQVPLPYAMRERIEKTPDSPYEDVIRSYVMLEIENSSGQILTLRRDIRGGVDQKLIRTWSRSINEIVEGEQSEQDFFVFDPGAAMREHGFHFFLASFIGWDLPTVPRFDGAEGLLYLETLFPLFFVEQKRGWSTTQGPLPTYLGIQDLSRRVMEFILDLDAGKIRREREELRRTLASIESHYSLRRQDIFEDAGRLVQVAGIPAKPNEDFANDGLINLSVFYNEDWVDLELAVSDAQREISEFDEVGLISVEDASGVVTEELAEAQKRYTELSGNIALLRQDFDFSIEERNAFQKRIHVLEIDLKRNQDAKKLEDLGSKLGEVNSSGSCPTCKQTVDAELLPLTSVRVMGLDENIAFVRSQLELYKSSLGYSNDNIAALKIK